MKEKTLNTINRNISKLLRPLVRILIRQGIPSSHLESLVRKAYVDESFALNEAKGSKTTVSSVAAQTGLSRKEVKRLKELPESDAQQQQQKYNRATRVLSAWVHHDAFIDQDGKPLPLNLSDKEPSFAQLIKKFSGDIPVKAMLDQLTSAGCIRVEDDQVYLLKMSYLPSNDQEELIKILGADTAELLDTIDHNINTALTEDKRYQRKVSTKHLDVKHLQAFKELSSEQAQSLLLSLDKWLSEHEAEEPENGCYVSLGIYFYESKNELKKGDANDISS
ncbi:DUF6502 family protein [Thiomicrorhabdus sp. 6S3-12]|uniref:DUF6502 family protein n=1 Tax=Thiomicrorhabdus sp. 6S3-12 TaxID=2819681 RepID=UPI001FB5B8CA|nr:DUF6502 family protein [Thiomicrorhabdus sp. 6S3-12]